MMLDNQNIENNARFLPVDAIDRSDDVCGCVHSSPAELLIYTNISAHSLRNYWKA